MAKLRLATILLVLGIVRGLEWESVPDDFVYACAGSKVTLPWRFKASEGEKVINVHWTHDGVLSSEVVATMVSGVFVTTERYSARARHVQNGGLVLEDVSEDDAGNYTVKVNVNDQGEFRSLQQSVYLQVAGELMAQGGQLRAEQDPEARWEESSQQWFIRLTCGTFTFLGPAPVDVTWITPSDETQPSTGYESGLFYLSLTTPVRGGNYTCTIPPGRRLDVCFNEHGAHDVRAVSATLALDETKARLSLLEANQKTLREDNDRLRTNQTMLLKDNERLQATQSSLRDQNDHLQEKLQTLEQVHERDMKNVTGYCQDIKTNMERQMEKLQSAHQSLQDEMEAQWNKTKQIAKLAQTGPCHSNNYTLNNDDYRAIQGEYSGNEDKCDKNMKAGWHRFLLHGQNAVIPTTCVPENHCHTDAPTWVDLQGQSLPDVGQEVEARACSHWSSDCCNWKAPITVRNCGEFFVYKIQPLDTCDLSFCVKLQE